MKVQVRRAATWASSGFSLLIVHAIASVFRDVFSLVVRSDFALEPTGVALALNGLALAAYLPLLGALVSLARAFFLDRHGP